MSSVRDIVILSPPSHPIPRTPPRRTSARNDSTSPPSSEIFSSAERRGRPVGGDAARPPPTAPPEPPLAAPPPPPVAALDIKDEADADAGADEDGKRTTESSKGRNCLVVSRSRAGTPEPGAAEGPPLPPAPTELSPSSEKIGEGIDPGALQRPRASAIAELFTGDIALCSIATRWRWMSAAVRSSSFSSNSRW